jgi:pimeloyl-ACP methyl ester carboxylesterase
VSDNVKLYAWIIRKIKSKNFLIYFHGVHGGLLFFIHIYLEINEIFLYIFFKDIFNCTETICKLSEHFNSTVIAFDYRGYGISTVFIN